MKHKNIAKQLQKLIRIKKETHHPLQHKLHKQHKISKKTIFYVKEYGSHSNVASRILKESIKILLLASVISSIGGLAIEKIKVIFISIIPLVILLPALNDMIGGYGAIFSSKFSTLLHEGKVKKNFRYDKEIKKLFLQILIIAVIMVIITTIFALIISSFTDYHVSSIIIVKILAIALIDVVLFVTLLMIVSIVAGLYIYRKQEDPNNFLIPIATSIADFGNMVILAGLVLLFF
ncbi:MAG TPA: magnesium transporter [Candidatus Nanoarchaeia archaeon]|nr:magnesium transporter [Candidatus Nanoarchaeia archaeon]